MRGMNERQTNKKVEEMRNGWRKMAKKRKNQWKGKKSKTEKLSETSNKMVFI